MRIQENIKQLTYLLPDGVQLVAVSKTKPIEYIEEAYQVGQRVFGESRPQEMASKYQALPKDIEWHMIGHLQDKNVKYIASFVTLIHSVDSLKLLCKINREAEKQNRVIDCLLEFHIAKEETKSGFKLSDAEQVLASEEFKMLTHIRIVGVMGIATYTENEDEVIQEFQNLQDIFKTLQQTFFADKAYFKELSMGMSEDYELAIKEGSTMVRIGSSIFGERAYNIK